MTLGSQHVAFITAIAIMTMIMCSVCEVWHIGLSQCVQCAKCDTLGYHNVFSVQTVTHWVITMCSVCKLWHIGLSRVQCAKCGILGYHNFVLSCALSVSPFPLLFLVHHLVLMFQFFLLPSIFFDLSFSFTIALRLVLTLYLLLLLSSSSYQAPSRTPSPHLTAQHCTPTNTQTPTLYKFPPLMATTKLSQLQEVAQIKCCLS